MSSDEDVRIITQKEVNQVKDYVTKNHPTDEEKASMALIYHKLKGDPTAVYSAGMRPGMLYCYKPLPEDLRKDFIQRIDLFFTNQNNKVPQG